MIDREFFSNIRVLFVLKGCIHCNQWKSFIETINLKLPTDKRIKLVDCTRYYEYNIVDDPLILKFRSKIDGVFPKLFIDGHMMEGSIEKDLLELFIRTYLIDEFVTPQYNKHIYSVQCEVIKKGGMFKNRIQCN